MLREELVLVTDFSTLRAGMIVVTKSCGICGGAHRMILTNQAKCSRDGHCFIISPSLCFGESIHIGPSAVKAGKVWRVVDGLESSQATTKTRELVKR